MRPAEYPGAVAIWADPTNSRARSGTVSLIVLHITDGHGVAENTAAMWQLPHHGSSAHFVIGQDGLVVQCVPLDHVAYHAHAANEHSIGIEHCARQPGEPAFGHDDPGLPLSPQQIEASRKLVAWVAGRYGLPQDVEHVKGHKEADPTTDHDDCPVKVAGRWPWPVWRS